MENNYKIFKIPRITKPGDINLNGIKYSKESYKLALDKLEILINAEVIFSELHIGNYTKFLSSISKENVCGTLKNVTDSFIEVKVLRNNKFFKIIEDYIENNKDIKSFMRYIAHKDNNIKNDEYILDRIITFDVILDSEKGVINNGSII